MTSCPEIAAENHADILLSNYDVSVGSYVVITCKGFGRHVAGPTEVLCQADGTWSGVPSLSCNRALDTRETLLVSVFAGAGTLLVVGLIIIACAVACERYDRSWRKRHYYGSQSDFSYRSDLRPPGYYDDDRQRWENYQLSRWDHGVARVDSYVDRDPRTSGIIVDRPYVSRYDQKIQRQERSYRYKKHKDKYGSRNSGRYQAPEREPEEDYSPDPTVIGSRMLWQPRYNYDYAVQSNYTRNQPYRETVTSTRQSPRAERRLPYPDYPGEAGYTDGQYYNGGFMVGNDPKTKRHGVFLDHILYQGLGRVTEIYGNPRLEHERRLYTVPTYGGTLRTEW